MLGMAQQPGYKVGQPGGEVGTVPHGRQAVSIHMDRSVASEVDVGVAAILKFVSHTVQNVSLR